MLKTIIIFLNFQGANFEGNFHYHADEFLNVMINFFDRIKGTGFLHLQSKLQWLELEK